jgi:transcription initiation factor TFIIIB Brf1 subunit/transcription initiation factor TFIIB
MLNNLTPADVKERFGKHGLLLTSLPDNVIREATKLLSKIPDSETGSNPIGIAASILYIVSVTSGHPFTQKQFAEAAEVNPQTVSNNTKRLNSIIKKNKLDSSTYPISRKISADEKVHAPTGIDIF